jgi:2,4-dienoyl-CoA reductase-like NADH-dependent reductase (Old Yellow Enzyme family)
VAPSPHSTKRGSARELTETEIERIIEAYVSAARRAREAGFDAVELHAAHGYLISQFLSPLSTQRADRGGVSLENRARFLREIFRRIESMQNGLFTYCRLGVADGEPGGLPLSEGIEVARMLKSDGIPLIHVSSGIGNPPSIAPEGSPYSDRAHLAIEVKKAVGVPVIGVGGFLLPETVESALAEGVIDCAAIARGLLVDPQWAVKAAADRADEILACRTCLTCHQFFHPERCPAMKGRRA